MSIDKFIRLKEKKCRNVIGLMSGTSCDGIDACLAKITGNGLSTKIEIMGFETYPYDNEIRELIFDASHQQNGTVDKICQLNFILGRHFADAVKLIARKSSLSISEIDIIGSHGQTIYHIPFSNENIDKSVRSTLQIGEPSVIAQETGVTTVADFRARDVAAGGDGSPLVAYADFILFGRDRISRAIQNIGGIANVTFLPVDCDINEIIAFDTGPGNMIIDRFTEIITDGKFKFDRGGELASKGKLNEDFLERLCSHPYLSKKPPKSTGREAFGVQYSDNLYKEMKRFKIDALDALATVTAFTALSISDSYSKYIQTSYQISEVIISGGGVHNLTLIEFLKGYLKDIKIRKVDEFNIPSETKEALSFAILANETVCGNPGNVPSATGARESVILGKIVPGK